MNKILVTLICMMMLLTFTSVGSAHTMTLSDNEILVGSNEKIQVTIQLTDNVGNPIQKAGVLTSLYTYKCSIHDRWQQKHTDATGKAVYELYQWSQCSTSRHVGDVKIKGHVYYTYGVDGGYYYDTIKVTDAYDTSNPPYICQPNWVCGEFGECQETHFYRDRGLKYKTCEDGCGHKKSMQQFCKLPDSEILKCTPKWTCSSYGECKTYGNSNWGYKHKTCVDGCGHSSTHKIRCTVSQPTPAPLPAVLGDLNNDRKISLSELITAIKKWSMKRYTDDQLIQIVRIYAG